MLKLKHNIFNFLGLVLNHMYFTSSSASASGKMYPNYENSKLVDSLISKGIVKTKSVEDAMKSIDRGDFVSYSPYQDSPQGIGYSATISAPHMHAYAMELLSNHLPYAKKSLDVGSGSGYLTLAFAKMMTTSGSVSYGIEHIPQLVQQSITNIRRNHNDYLTTNKIVIIEGDGRLGLPDYASYDCIHVGAAAQELPDYLVEQLAPGGRMLIPIGKPGSQEFTVVDKDQTGKIKLTAAFGVSYIPLTSKERQYSGK